MHHRPRAKEQQPLEGGMIQHVQQPAGETQRRDRRQAVANPQQAQSDADRDDADVFHAGIGQQPFQVALRQREQHAVQPRGDAQAQHEPGAPGRHATQQRQRAENSVDARLDHHARHHRRHRTRRRRMRLGEPDVERDQAGLGSKTNQRQQEQAAGRAGRRRVRREILRAARATQQEEQRQQKRQADVAGHQIGPARFPHAGRRVVVDHQEERRQGHRLPGHEEEHAVPRQQHDRQARDQRVVEQPEPPRIASVPRPEIADGVDRGQPGKQEGRQEEKRGQRIDPRRERAVRHVPGERPRGIRAEHQRQRRRDQAGQARRDRARRAQPHGPALGAPSRDGGGDPAGDQQADGPKQAEQQDGSLRRHRVRLSSAQTGPLRGGAPPPGSRPPPPAGPSIP